MKGSCLCRAVSYECDQLSSGIMNCHCNTCRKAQAARYAPTARVEREHFRWRQGEHLLKSYESSVGKFRYFCSVCGSHLMAERPAERHVILRVATLDDAPAFKAISHIWCSHDLPWLVDNQDTPHFAEWPPEHS